jgi:hypothetical protein
MKAVSGVDIDVKTLCTLQAVSLGRQGQGRDGERGREGEGEQMIRRTLKRKREIDRENKRRQGFCTGNSERSPVRNMPRFRLPSARDIYLFILFIYLHILHT